MRAPGSRGEVEMSQEVLASAALAVLPCGVAVLSDGGVLLCNEHLAQLIVSHTGELVGRPFEQLFAPSQRAGLQRALRSVVTHGLSLEPLELVAHRVDGSTVIVDVRLSPLERPEGRLVLATVTDAWERLRSTGALVRLAFEDSLTALPNRASYLDALNKALLSGKRRGDGFAVALIDVDGFKAVNDSAGHDVGDLVLREVGARLRTAVRESDVVARLGGDEFTLLLPGILDERGAARVGEAVARSLAPPFVVAPHSFSLGASVGFALFPQHGGDMHSLLIAADSAMYQAKRSGKGGARLFDGVVRGAPRHLDRALTWTPQLHIGIPEIDDEHRALAASVNALLDALSGAESDAVIRARLSDLSDLAAKHFASEEGHMRRASYAELAQHSAEHRHLMRELGALPEAFEQRGLSQSLQFVRDWFLVHLEEADRVYARWVLQH